MKVDHRVFGSIIKRRIRVKRRAPRFRARMLLGLVGALVGLSGCGMTGSPGSTDQADANGPITLDFWNGFTGPDGKTMEAMVKQFHAANPDITIRMQIIPWGTYYDKVTLALAYGGAPDVFILHAARLSEYASFNVLRPIDDLREAKGTGAPLPVADFARVPWKATFYKGKQYGLPLDVHPLGLYYNRALFKAAGITDANGNAKPPTNWDEFLAAAKKLTRDTNGDGRPDEWGFVFTNQHSNWYTFATQFGAGIVTEDGRRCAMDTPANLVALNRMRDLIYRYHVTPKPEGIDAWLAFRQGKVGMVMEGIYMLASLEEQKGLPYAGAPAPQFGPNPGVWGGSHVLCQPVGGSPRRVTAAWRFIRFLSDHSLTWAKGGQVPVRLSILHSAEFQALPVQSQFAKQVGFVRYDPTIPRGNALGQFVDPAVEAVLIGLQTPKAAMNDACRRITQALERP